MNRKKWMQIVLMSSVILALTACSSARKRQQDAAAINEANAAYRSDDRIQTSGIGEPARFSDQYGRYKNKSNRVYYFDFDSNVVHQQDKPAILANAKYLVKHPNAKVLLEGHTDPRGSREYNIGLGERRAKAVAQILRSQGASPRQIRIVSYGAEKLAVIGHTEADYRLDRRVVLAYLQR